LINGLLNVHCQKNTLSNNKLYAQQAAQVRRAKNARVLAWSLGSKRNY
jgi:hypothetical protein